jgi:hypothetical protein
MKTREKTALQVKLLEARNVLKASRTNVKTLTLEVKAESQARKQARVDMLAAFKAIKAAARADRAEKRDAKRTEALNKAKARIAKAQAKLEALEAKKFAPKTIRKNQRKASPVTVLVENGVATKAA